MAEMWYYTSEGKQMDPVTMRELKRLVGDGTLKPTDMVWKDGMPRWIRASSLKELFPDPTSALDKYFSHSKEAEKKDTSASAVTAPPAKPAAAAPAAAPAVSPKAEAEPKKRRPPDSEPDDGSPPRRRAEPKSGGGSIVVILFLLFGAFVVLGGLFGGVIILIFFFKPGGANPKTPIVDGVKEKRAKVIEGVEKFEEQLPANDANGKERRYTFRQGVAYDISALYQPKNDGANVELFVFHADGKQLAGPDRFLKWTPNEEGEYRVRVANNGGGDVKAAVTIKEWKDDPPPKGVFTGKGSLDSKTLLKPNGSTTLKMRVRAGFPATINVTPLKSGPGTNFDIFVTKEDNPNEVYLSDVRPDANASVRFERPDTEIVRVQIRNVGKTTNQVSILYHVSP